jgi:signal peptidase I
MSEERRPVLRRIGIAALNWFAPGLGLLRLGRPRQAIAFYLAFAAAGVALIAFYAATDELNFRAYVISVALLVLVILGTLVGSIAASWRASRSIAAVQPVWSRWYSMLAVLVATLLLAELFGRAAHGFYKPFYIPSEAMMPTFVKNDWLIASMRGPGRLRRGDIVLFRMGDHIYIKRIAALPGDRIGLDGGVVVLNGRPVPQRLVRVEAIEGDFGATGARRLAEQFPGEADPHEIYDQGGHGLEDVAERQVMPGHVFVLGDNRDRSADSRVPREQMGVEQLPVADIIGRAKFRTWGPSGRTGERLDR